MSLSNPAVLKTPAGLAAALFFEDFMRTTNHARLAKRLIRQALHGDSLSITLLLAVTLGPFNRGLLIQYANDRLRPLELRRLAVVLSIEVQRESA